MDIEALAKRLGAGEFAPTIQSVCNRYHITTRLRACHFLAQIAHESRGFKSTQESMNYSVSGLLKGFGRHRISEEDASKFGRPDNVKTPLTTAQQNPIANILYGGAFGRKNGNTQPGDGWRFRGRGFAQLTWRPNYAAYSLAAYGDDRIVQDPDLVVKNPDAAMSAGWFWDRNGLNDLADADNLLTISRVFNLGSRTTKAMPKGIEDRKAWLARAKAEWDRIA
jgi:putative chitinase